MSARTDLAANLKAELPDYTVLPYTRNIDHVDGITLAVETSNLALEGRRWMASMSLYVITGLEDPEAAEDALEDAVLEVLEVLALHLDVLNLSADRTVYGEFHAYAITLKTSFKEE